MKVYFLSSIPCALRVNNTYFGTTNLFERFAELSLQDNLFVEFLPAGRQPLSFFLTENIRFSAPKGCEIYLLKDSLAIYARDFPPSDFTLRVHAQKREQATLATLFSQGELTLSIEGNAGLFIAHLPPSFTQSELFFDSGLVFVKAPDALAVFTQNAELCLCEKVLSYALENGVLSARLPLAEGRYAECEWALAEYGCTRQKCVVHTPENPPNTPTPFLAYTFFESVLIGANYAEFLADGLIDKASDLLLFLGDFTGVVLTDDPCACGLLRKKADGIFEAAYYTVRLENGKIADITA